MQKNRQIIQFQKLKKYIINKKIHKTNKFINIDILLIKMKNSNNFHGSCVATQINVLVWRQKGR